MAYVSRMSSPISDKDYETRDEAIAAFCEPPYAGAAPTIIEWIDDKRFKQRGDIYQIEDGRNPRAAPAEAVATNPEKFAGERATRAQIDYLLKLKKGVPSSAWEHWIGDNLHSVSKTHATRAITALGIIFAR